MTLKDKSITKIFNHLQKKFGRSEILLKDYWVADLCAIGLTNKTEEYLVYISTFGKKENTYYIALEETSANESYPFITIGGFNNLSSSELEAIVQSHLKIK